MAESPTATNSVTLCNKFSASICARENANDNNKKL